MYQRLFSVHSLDLVLRTLCDPFGEQLRVVESAIGHTSLEVSLDHRSYLQAIGVPPDRRYPSNSSLHSQPLITRLFLIHPSKQLRTYVNGSVHFYFLGSSSPGTVIYQIGYRTQGPYRLEKGKSSQRRYLLRTYKKTLDTLLSSLSQKQKKKE